MIPSRRPFSLFSLPSTLHLLASCLIASCGISQLGLAAEPSAQPWLKVAANHRGFECEGTGAPFAPWGFNYDHDREGRLLEDYWEAEWPTVVEDFKEMKALRANVVRVHLQFGKFMRSATEPNPTALAQWGKLIELAERQRLYLDVTGLGCYHKPDVPAWYDELDEAGRWAAQANFWESVAARGAASPAIFCYDLMNEPVVPGGAKQENWLGPPFGDKYFVQFITRDRGTRARPDVARAWVAQLSAAVRRQDRRHLVTLGMVPWSLARPGLTSGFEPNRIAEPLDFLCVHLYPKSGKLEEDIETLRAFNVGKPVVIEEIFPLGCSSQELEKFLDLSAPHRAGLIGFYWGQTPDELRPPKTIGNAILLNWLELFQRLAP